MTPPLFTILVALALLTTSNVVEVSRLERGRVHDVLEKIVILVGMCATLWYIGDNNKQQLLSTNRLYTLVFLLCYFWFLNRVAVFFICNRLTKHLRDDGI